MTPVKMTLHFETKNVISSKHISILLGEAFRLTIKLYRLEGNGLAEDHLHFFQLLCVSRHECDRLRQCHLHFRDRHCFGLCFSVWPSLISCEIQRNGLLPLSKRTSFTSTTTRKKKQNLTTFPQKIGTSKMRKVES